MKSFEQLEAVETFEPTLELVDLIVEGLHQTHAKGEGATPWLVPYDTADKYFPDGVVHTRIDLHPKGWKVLTVQRKTGEDAYHHETVAKVYDRSPEGLFMDEYIFKRNIYMPSVSIFSERDTHGEHMEVLYGHFLDLIVIPKSRIPRGYSGNENQRKAMQKHSRSLQRGSFMMRVWEKNYLGQKINLGRH